MELLNALFIFTFISTLNTGHTINFGKNTDGNDWYVVNDGVMGGLSSSAISFTKNSMLFTGTVSLENNGGFASVRSSRANLDLSSYKTATIRFRSKSKDRIFALRLNTNDVYYKPSYNQKFQCTSDDWQELTFNLTDFRETIMGRETGKTISNKKLSNVIRVGIMLNDKKEGSFTIEIDSITFQ